MVVEAKATMPAVAQPAASSLSRDWPPNTSVVCTLAEGEYFHGVAALINSLVQAEFEGNVVVGYRGSKPHWLASLRPGDTVDVYLGYRMCPVAFG